MTSGSLQRLFADHRREWGTALYAYPVISRRAGGLSLGINLSPDDFCDFSCAYCCVTHRVERGRPVRIDLERLVEEVRALIEASLSGEIWLEDRFAGTPPEWRHVRDITFAGNGEPCLCPDFAESVARVYQLREELCPEVPLVLLTNGTTLESPKMAPTLTRFYEGPGEIWVKFDAGNERVFREINQSRMPYERWWQQLKTYALSHPIVLQSLQMRWEGATCDWGHFGDWLDRLGELLDSGAQIQRVQLYSVARQPRDAQCQPLDVTELCEMARLCRERFPTLSLQTA